MAANADIYFEHDRWGRALAWSLGLHLGITVFLLVYSSVFYRTNGDTWGAGGAKGGFGITGGGGDFGSKYAWYVHVIQQKVAENWLKYEVDPRISNAQRVYITFD